MNRSFAPAGTLANAEEDPRSSSEVDLSGLLRLATHGTAWTLTAYLLAQVMRLGGNLLLSRVLAPQHFGLMTLLNTVIIGLNLFSDLGIAPSIICSKTGDDPKLLNTAWTMQAARGIGLWIICLCLSGPIARFYGEPQLQVMFVVVGICVVIAGFQSTTLATMAKRMAVRELVLMELTVQAAQLVFTLIWSLIQPSVWALIGGRVFSELLKMILSYRLATSHRHHFAWDKDSALSLFAFGRWIFISTALTFVATQSDRLILGKLVGLRTLGLYGIAFALADIPRQVILQFSGRIAFPFVSKLAHGSRGNFRAMILRYRLPVLAIAAIGLALVVNSGDSVLVHLYDSRYADAAWMVPILALGLWHTVLYCTANPCLLAVGKPQYNSLGYLLSAVVILGLTPWSFVHWGMPGAVWTLSFGDLPMYFASLFGLWYEDLCLVSQDLKMTLVFIAALALFYWMRISVGISFPHAVSLR